MRKLSLLFILATVLSFSYGQSIVSITQTSANQGETFTASVTGSAVDWTFTSPTVFLANSYGDTIYGTNVTYDNATQVTADFDALCTFDIDFYDVGTYDLTYGALVLSSGFTLNGMSGVTSSFVDASCNSSCNGSLTYSGTTGGVAPYAIEWFNSSLTSQGTGNSIISLCPDTYSLDVTDANGCVYTVGGLVISEPSPLTASHSYVDATCFSFCDGEATVTASGGVAPYTYSWSPAPSGGQGTATATGLCTGTYTCTITDDNGCTLNEFVTISEPTLLTATISNVYDVYCFGNCDGGADVVASGGAGNYTYTWSGGGQTTASAINLCAGTYTATVMDDLGCTATANVTITQPGAALVATISSTDPLCVGSCDGTADAIASGGTGNYTYNWSPAPGAGQNTSTVTGLCANTYTLTVMDDNGCMSTEFATLSDPPAIIASPILNDPLCFGSPDGSIEINVTNGVAPYLYSIDSGATTQTSNIFNGLSAGSYDVFVIDDNGCSNANGQSLIDPNLMMLSVYPSSPICPGGTDGYAEIVVDNGGTAPFSYSFDNGNSYQASNVNSTMSAGSYTAAVQDNNGCVMNAPFTITDPFSLTFSAVTTDPTSCGGSDGYITLSGLTASTIYNVSYDLNTVSNGPSSQFSDATGDLIIPTLGGGTYTNITLENSGCSYTDPATYILTEPNNGLMLDVTGMMVTDASCAGNDGSIAGISTVGGSAPYQYDYNGNVQATADLANAAAGSYILTVMDAGGCSVQTAPITINGMTASLVHTISTMDVTCLGACDGTASIVTTGGTAPYSYQWSNGMTGANLTGVCAGYLEVYVTDANGCEGTDGKSITEPSPISSSVSVTAPTCGEDDGVLTVSNTSGGTASYTYQWSSGEFGSEADSLTAGVYSLTTTDANGCQAVQQFTLASSLAPFLSASYVEPTCAGTSNGAIDLTISGGTAPFIIDWSTGHSSEDLSNLPAGVYDVTVTDDAGCSLNQTFTLNDAIPIDLSDVNIIDAMCGNADGEIMVTPTGGTGNYNYLWSSGGTNDMESSLTAGSYTLSVSDDNGCLAMRTYTVSNDGGPKITVDQVVQPTCEGGTGKVYVTINDGTPPYSYQWSDGSSNEDLLNVPVGEYELVVTDANGCQGVNYAELEGINLSAAEICLVSVDTTSGGNLVVWNKEFNLGIAEYEIYRETSVFNHFQKLATVPFDSLSQYVDSAANSGVHSYRYKLRTIDSCENASDFLATHKTIHLASNLGLNNVVNLAWDDYVGFNYTTFYINRYHPSTGWVEIAQVASNVHSYSDGTHPGLTGLEYSIEVRPDVPCSAEKAQDHNSTRSNKATFVVYDVSAGLEEQVNAIYLSPNPTDGFVNIVVEGITASADVRIVDMNGKVVKRLVLNNVGQSNALDVNDLEDGIYFISVDYDGHHQITKLIKL